MKYSLHTNTATRRSLLLENIEIEHELDAEVQVTRLGDVRKNTSTKSDYTSQFSKSFVSITTINMASTALPPTTIAPTTKVSSRFQILRQSIRNNLDKRAAAKGKKRTSILADKSTTNKLKNDKRATAGGVFFKVPSVASLHSSDSTISSGTSNYGSARSIVSSCNNSTSPPTPATSWKSTERQSFLLNQPMMVSDIEHIDLEIEKDPVAALGKVMARCNKLPSTDYFSSNHIMVNEERIKRMIAPLSRLRELDEMARRHAEEMAKSQSLYHSDPATITNQFHRPFRRMGENVSRGSNLRNIHTNMMVTTEQRPDRYNILHRCYTHMGMGTAKGEDGQLYLCQIFRG